jgi:uncharacterized protein DUF5715/LysM domain-containing protein
MLAWGLCVGAGTPQEVSSQSLRGSTASMDRQVRMASRHDYTYIETPDRVDFFANRGWLVPIRGNRNFSLHAVSFPYARPAVQTFIERLSDQYRRACGEQLVVTSLTRPQNRQPRNASDRTVHPTGMAVDLRYSWDRNCRKWLETVLMSLERQGVLEATLERNPRHYHVALFPDLYASYVEALISRGVGTPESLEYRVRSGDSLWKIAITYGVTVDAIKDANGLRGSRIMAGQVIELPLGS